MWGETRVALQLVFPPLLQVVRADADDGITVEWPVVPVARPGTVVYCTVAGDAPHLNVFSGTCKRPGSNARWKNATEVGDTPENTRDSARCHSSERGPTWCRLCTMGWVTCKGLAMDTEEWLSVVVRARGSRERPEAKLIWSWPPPPPCEPDFCKSITWAIDRPADRGIEANEARVGTSPDARTWPTGI